jgi:diaminopimelate epimerase
MEVLFYKYQGTGNDFVMLHNLDGKYDDLSINQVRLLCARRFGVGADGLIKINAHPNFAFEVDYFNADGSKSFCGNGARCSVAFAEHLGINVDTCEFWAIDGKHVARKQKDLIHLGMSNVQQVAQIGSDYILDTGSPHFVRFIDDLTSEDIVAFGKTIRYSEAYKQEGINVNLAQEITETELRVLTYERGVEDETYSCGTGVTAVVLAYAKKKGLFGLHQIDVQVKGGHLAVRFNRIQEDQFQEISLIGPGEFIYSGMIHV